MKTKKRKVGRPKLKKENKAKAKPKKKTNGYKDAVVFYLAEIDKISGDSASYLWRIVELLEKLNMKILNIGSDVESIKKTIYEKNPKLPPMEEPKSEETPH